VHTGIPHDCGSTITNLGSQYLPKELRFTPFLVDEVSAVTLSLKQTPWTSQIIYRMSRRKALAAKLI
jgi:hypothetical protein